MSGQPHDIREKIRNIVEHFEHVLPGQAPIKDFVHHNTLHGYQHLHFKDALKAAREVTGASGYLPIEEFRTLYEQGRISSNELNQVLNEDKDLQAQQPLFDRVNGEVVRQDIYHVALTRPLESISGCQLNWQLEEMDAFGRFQDDVKKESRETLLATAATKGLKEEAEAIDDLWKACLEVLELEHYILHPEDLVDLSAEQADALLIREAKETEVGAISVQHHIRRESTHYLKELLDKVGSELTLRGLLQSLTGIDLVNEIRPIMIRRMAGFVDQGLAAWEPPGRDKGFYAAWREGARQDPAWIISSIPEWQDHIDSLPEDALETIIAELRRMDLPEDRWLKYLERKALELPGWSGMFLWRHQHPGYEGQNYPVDMMDYLAFRLALERLISQRLCRDIWQIEPSLRILRWHFRNNPAELFVRHALFNTRLPEYLISLSQKLVHNDSRLVTEEDWQQVAALIWVWRQSPSADRPTGYTVFREGWQLFRLAQHLGLSGAEIRELRNDQVGAIFDCLQRLDADRSGFIWLQAYERHYRDELFAAVSANQGRGSWKKRDGRISAQLVFCMDDREEGIRRHLEEIDPSVETLGAAAHFNVPNLWCGLDDKVPTGLTPVVIEPVHLVREQAVKEQGGLLDRHRRRRTRRLQVNNLLNQEIRRNLFSSALLLAVAAPGALLTLAGKVLSPLRTGRLMERLVSRHDKEITTEIEFCAADDGPVPTPENPRHGFTDQEQLERVAVFLQNIGLKSGFASLVVIMAHGSDSENNPHLAAYNCGACSGRHSGPNARILAAIANRRVIRKQLADKYQIHIPDSSWFIGAERNTCTERITWYDLETMPDQFQPELERLQTNLRKASQRHAHERCRKFVSAPLSLTPERALDHVIGRSYDFSQARPELGHATNAAAFIGRRSLSRGLFLDRRVFLISYDPTTDETGEVLERLLLANGPVGAGINLEYYFSTVDNENYGCGTKITHNVNGMLGVMEGATSDLRTGLPRQMIEIHEAMRLQVMVEATTERLTEIYTRQPPLQELIGNGWLLVTAVDPNNGDITIFDPEQGWLPWEAPVQSLSQVQQSDQYYRGRREPLSPILVDEKEVPANA